MATVHIFLSTVTAEFRSYRDALSRDLNRPNVTVKVQEDFIATGRETLLLLDTYIRQCDAVIQLVGNMTGAMAKVQSVTAILEKYPDFAERLPGLSPFLEPGGPSLPYTQWEAWLALYHRKCLIICAPEEDAPRDETYRDTPEQRAAQREHLERLAEIERYPQIRFANSDRLAVEVLRSELHEILSSAGQPREAHERPQMAPPLDRMVERADLQNKLLAALSSEHAALVGLVGPGGFGKTRLATWVCHQHKIDQRYPGGVLWVTLGQKAAGTHLAERINDLSFLLSKKRPAISDPDAAGGELGRLLDERKPTLLVVDDVWTETQLRPFQFGGRACSRLITTRIADLLLREATLIPVDVMSNEEALRFVSDGLPELPREVAEDLGNQAGRWPVLLNIVNGALRKRVKKGETQEQAGRAVLQRLCARGPTALDPLRSADPANADERKQAIQATVDASLHLLDSRVQRMYLDLAIFPEGVEIPFDVLALLWDEDLPEAVCEELVRLGLAADYRLDPPGFRLVLQDVLRAFLHGRLARSERVEVHKRLIEAASRLLSSSSQTSPGEAQRPWWTLPKERLYLWLFLPHHLYEADASEELNELVCDLRWVEAKARVFGSAVGCEADLTLVKNPTAHALRNVLQSSASLFGSIEPPAALAATLASRLHGIPGLSAILERYRTGLGRPFLEPAQRMPDQPVPSLSASEQSQPAAGRGHVGSATSCAFSPDETLFATTGDDGTVRLWNVGDWTLQTVLPTHSTGIRDCAFSHDGTLLATAGSDRSVRLWDLPSGAPKEALTGHTNWVNACTFSEDDTLLASVGDDNTVRLWDLADGTEKAVLKGHEAWVNRCAFSPNGDLLASVGDDHHVRLWNIPEGTERAVLKGHTGNVRSCAFSPDGILIATAGRDQTLRLWRASDGHEIAVVTDEVAWMTDCAFSPDGTQVVGTTSEGIVRRWRLPDLVEQETLVGDTGWITRVVFSPRGMYLAATSSEGGWRVWRMPADTLETMFGGDERRANGCAFAPSNSLLAAAKSNGEVQLLRPDDADRWTETARLVGHTGAVRTCAFSPSGDLLATAADDRTARIWSTDGSGSGKSLAGHLGRVTGCCFSPDGTLLATSSNDRTVRLWRVDDGTVVASLDSHSTRVTSCAFSPKGDLLATTGEEGQVNLWRMPDGRQHASLVGHTGWMNGCAFSPDGSLIATVGDDRTTRLWRVADGEKHVELIGDDGWVQGCAFDPDGALLATVSRDGVARVWDTTDGQCRCALRVAGSLLGVAWHPDGGLLSLAGEAGVYLLAYRP